jgi:hypothetical protein
MDEFSPEALGAELALKWANEEGTTTHRHVLAALVNRLFATEDPRAQLEQLVHVSRAVDEWILDIGDGIVLEVPTALAPVTEYVGNLPPEVEP